jgi:hypothetical protein
MVKKYSIIPYVVAAFLLVPSGGIVGWWARGMWSVRSVGSLEIPEPEATAGLEFPGARTSHMGAGTWKIPLEAPTGEYVLAINGSTFNCSWRVLTRLDGKPKSVRDSGWVNRGGGASFILRPSDKYLQLTGDCAWERTGDPHGQIDSRSNR